MITIGAVSYLNALPLVHGLEDRSDVRLVRQVPSALLAGLEHGKLDIALCPIIDAQTTALDLDLIPCGAIGSHAETLTVGIFSTVPLNRVERLSVDRDSHTSVALAQIVFSRTFDRIPDLVPLRSDASNEESPIEAALLIGDKVVTSRPDPSRYPFHLDLGRAWRDLTGLPFVFAAWMAIRGTEIGPVSQTLEEIRSNNRFHLETLVPLWARRHQWPPDLALVYLRDLLDFDLGPLQLQAIRLFWKECAELGLIGSVRDVGFDHSP